VDVNFCEKLAVNILVYFQLNIIKLIKLQRPLIVLEGHGLWLEIYISVLTFIEISICRGARVRGLFWGLRRNN
jgi:hypothetical protein